jgi:hypothetical protein
VLVQIANQEGSGTEIAYIIFKSLEITDPLSWLFKPLTVNNDTNVTQETIEP